MAAAAVAALSGLVAARDTSTVRLAPRLSSLARSAHLIVLADVGALTEVDDGRLVEAHLRVSRMLSGPEQTVAATVVEDRRFPSVPPVMRTGRRVLAFLEEAPSTSQLRRALSPGVHYRVAGGRWGLLDLPDAAAENVALEVVTGWISLAEDELDEVARSALRRRLTFVELAAADPRLVEDGAAELAELPGLSASLQDSERDVIVAALGREDLPERVRIGLVDTVVRARLRSVSPALDRLDGAGPDLRRAAIRARVQLGQTRERAKLVEALSDDDPAARLAAVHELQEIGTQEAVAEVAGLAVGDPDREVRLAAIEALGKAPSPAAMEALGKTFADASREIRRRSAQVIYGIGGRPAATLLAELAFEAPAEAQRQAVVLLLTLGIPRDDPLVRRIRDTHPNPALRDLAEHGLQVHSH
jgi:HEAT repeat protein